MNALLAKNSPTCFLLAALDPAGPQFTMSSCIALASECRLHNTDADLVDVIHTDATAAGLYDRMGHVDFYPNGGANQPGCSRESTVTPPVT